MQSIEYGRDEFLMVSKVVSWSVTRSDNKITGLAITMINGIKIHVTDGYREGVHLALKGK